MKEIMKFGGKEIKTNTIHRVVRVTPAPGVDGHYVVLQHGKDGTSVTVQKFEASPESIKVFKRVMEDVRDVEISGKNWVVAETASWEPEGFRLTHNSLEDYYKWKNAP